MELKEDNIVSLPQENVTKEVPEAVKLEVAKILNVDEIKENSVVFLRLTSEEVDVNLMLALREIAERYGAKLREKNCTILLIGKDVKVDELDEKSMGEHGWKRQGLILTP